jgi:hypothetical protein
VKLLTFRKNATYAHTLKLAPVTSQPFVSFGNGDTITHPNETGSTSSSRVRSISLTEDDQGELSYMLELNDVRREVVERHDNWLKRAAAGSLAGGARVTSKSGDAISSAVRLSATSVVEFSWDGPLAAGVSPKRPADQSGNLIELYVQLTEAGSTSTQVRVLQNGVAIGTVTVPAGETSEALRMDADKVHRNDDVFQAEIVTAGTGAEGLDVQVRAI